jgi:MFS family permease
MWIALIAHAGMDYAQMIAPLMVAGVGISMTFPAAQNSVVGSVPAEAIGKAAGTNSTMRELGGVLGIALGVAAFAGAGSYATPAEFSDGFVAAMGVSAGLSVLAALAGMALPARPATRSLQPAQGGVTATPAISSHLLEATKETT